jgi:hypothetical protein
MERISGLFCCDLEMIAQRSKAACVVPEELIGKSVTVGIDRFLDRRGPAANRAT